MENSLEKSISQQEVDQLARSTKKSKRKITHLIFDNQPNQDTTIQTQVPHLSSSHIPGPTPLINKISTTPPSFRDMLKGSRPGGISDIQNEAMSDEDDISDDDMAPEDMMEDERCPVILLSKEEKRRMRKPWRN